MRGRNSNTSTEPSLSPSTQALPRVGCIRAAAIWSRVVFPAPLGPSTTHRSPAWTTQSTSPTSTDPPRTMDTPSSRRTSDISPEPTARVEHPRASDIGRVITTAGAGATRTHPYAGPVRPTLPRAALLAVWGTAALDGRTSPDEAVDRVAPGGAPLRFGGLPGEAVVGLTLALGRLRALGATGLRLVLPVPGDPAGLPGPRAFIEEAVACRAAVVTVGETSDVGIGLLPGIRNAWQAHRVLPGGGVDLPLLAEADRALTETLRLTAEELVRLDVARWRPEVAAGRGRHPRGRRAGREPAAGAAQPRPPGPGPGPAGRGDRRAGRRRPRWRGQRRGDGLARRGAGPAGHGEPPGAGRGLQRGARARAGAPLAHRALNPSPRESLGAAF